MSPNAPENRFRRVVEGPEPVDRFYREEVQLALRNRGMPLEALRYPITPTGLHYLLVHFDIPDLDAGAWWLDVAGLVRKPLRLSLDDLKRRPSRTLPVTMECAGNGRALMEPRPVSQPWLVEATSTAEWTGTSLGGVLEEAGLGEGAREVLFTGADEGIQGDEVQFYQRSLTVAEAMRADVLLAYAMNGEPLQPQHGYPLRLLVPGWYGMTSVKWLRSIAVIDHEFQGYQQTHSYRYSKSPDELGEPVDLIRVRALMAPPGIPDFLTRTRLLKPGRVTLTGRAWAGRLAVASVEVSADGGHTWGRARLDAPVGPLAWRGWSYVWKAMSGRHALCVRATDETGESQPLGQNWNYHGMGNNLVQRVEVIVE